MYTSCLEKQAQIKIQFADCRTVEERYTRIMELGRRLPPLAPQYKVADNLVKGCQSLMYLRSYMEDGRVIFEGESDALISEGLAALLIAVYSGEPPESILKCPPTFLDDLQIASSLSPNRASGLYSLLVRMKQDALKYLVGKG
jgi:cysteine desulfuration protein SufE